MMLKERSRSLILASYVGCEIETEHLFVCCLLSCFKGNDEVFECIWKELSKQVEVKHYRLREEAGKPPTENLRPFFVKDANGWMDNRRIYCSFRFDKDAQKKIGRIVSDKRYLLLNKGRVDKDGTKIQHSQELNKYPHVSPEMVKSSDRVDLFDTMRYPLAKAHGCLMVIAWMAACLTSSEPRNYEFRITK
ncbi:hypothetical protein HELRODRAFT_165018 [Helobdella robusta]|uniref:Uncharacterized protein n=1 Tax=Helobdella robusta TaxID=6412 RepID=T1EW52_HELRO|nr:hypothetical protein HELRODRAFT_165018 [Helobdella robusta]ESN92887.1 hypothetical protein HELRODRAFT_165018 [Helobdella robusta]